MAKKKPLKEALEDYFEDTRKPVYSFVIVVPLLLVYEVGLIILRGRSPKYMAVNGADDLIGRMLSLVGVHFTFVSVAVVGICFAIWEYRRRGGWKLDSNFVGWLYAECMLYALFLFVMPGQFLTAAVEGGTGSEDPGLFAQLVLSCGAGVYEELVFRLILVGLVALFFKHVIHLDNVRAGVLAVAFGAIVFSAFHYDGLLGTKYGDPFDPSSGLFWRTFIFRAAAGAFFSTLFYFRSFGVAVGAHALYDIMASVAAALATPGTQ